MRRSNSRENRSEWTGAPSRNVNTKSWSRASRPEQHALLDLALVVFAQFGH